MNVDAWRAGLGPSAQSLSPPAAASAPGAHSLPLLDASYPGLGPVMGIRVPTEAVVVSVSHPPLTPPILGSTFPRESPVWGSMRQQPGGGAGAAIREGFLEVSNLHLGALKNDDVLGRADPVGGT